MDAARATAAHGHDITAVLRTGGGDDLALRVGRNVAARVITAGPDGHAQLSIAGQTVSVRTNLPVQPGDTIALQVKDVSNGRVVLGPPQATAPGPAPSTSTSASIPTAAGVRAEFAAALPAAAQALARDGASVTPDLVRAVAQAVQQSVSAQSPQQVAEAARAFAALAARGLELSPAAATRIQTAIELAGKLGAELDRLAQSSPALRLALPTGSPTAANVAAFASNQLTHAEAAVARVAQALGASQPGISVPTPGTGFGPQGSAAQAAVAIRGEAGLPVVASVVQRALAAGPGTPAVAAGNPAAAGAGHVAGGQAAIGQIPAAVAGTGHARVGAEQAALAASGPATRPAVAEVAASLSGQLARFVSTAAPAEGALGQHLGQLATAEQTSVAARSAGLAGATGAGAGAGGGLPLVHALQYLAHTGATADTASPQYAAALRTVAAASGDQLAAALRQLPETEALQVAGRLMGLAAIIQEGTSERAASVRQLIADHLNQLGAALRPGGEEAAIRGALEQLVREGRGASADQAQRVLHALDGGQLLSAPRPGGGDPGYAWFQMPMPGGQDAEVLVRRDPGRGELSFDNFSMAFLLHTEHLGSLLIKLDGHPGGLAASVRTDRDDLTAWLDEQSELLTEPLAQAAGRPVSVKVSVLATEPPTSLLAASLTAGPDPGARTYYA